MRSPLKTPERIVRSWRPGVIKEFLIRLSARCEEGIGSVKRGGSPKGLRYRDVVFTIARQRPLAAFGGVEDDT
jgi:hypothetical protein